MSIVVIICTIYIYIYMYMYIHILNFLTFILLMYSLTFLVGGVGAVALFRGFRASPLLKIRLPLESSNVTPQKGGAALFSFILLWL